jgi:membrane-associated phospholipid phosphatase
MDFRFLTYLINPAEVWHSAMYNAHRWFWAASVLLGMFLLYTAIFATGVFLNLTLLQEQWLLHRPLTGVDCVFHLWASLGEVPVSLLLTLILGIGCLCLGYRRRILPYLLLVLLLGVSTEFAGKQLFPQPIPVSFSTGREALNCPQIEDQPYTVKLLVLLGMWLQAPPMPPQSIRDAQYSATTPFTLDNTYTEYSYPSGHAIRWSFLGLVTCWLVWRHFRRRNLRMLRGLFMALALVVAFTGGFAQFYIGAHLTTDLIAGYLLGAGSACCAIGILLQNKMSPGGLSVSDKCKSPTSVVK